MNAWERSLEAASAELDQRVGAPPSFPSEHTFN